MEKHLLLVNHIGTSFVDGLETEIAPLMDDVKNAARAADKNCHVVLTFNSERAINKLKKRGIIIPTVRQCLANAEVSSYTKISILPLHVVGGADYAKLQRTAGQYIGPIEVLPPLLRSDSSCKILAKMLLSLIKDQDSDKIPIFIGHGSQESSNHLYQKLEWHLKQLEPNASVLTLLDKIQEKSKSYTKKELLLFPLFAVSGYHLRKDCFESEDSIQAKLTALGFHITAYQQGLLSYPQVRSLLINQINWRQVWK